jgi:hypothetical protein
MSGAGLGSSLQPDLRVWIQMALARQAHVRMICSDTHHLNHVSARENGHLVVDFRHGNGAFEGVREGVETSQSQFAISQYLHKGVECDVPPKLGSRVHWSAILVRWHFMNL